MNKNVDVKVECPDCENLDVVKSGIRRNKSGKKQRYTCNKCGTRFVVDDGFKGAHFTPEIITRAMHEYSDCASLSYDQKYYNKDVRYIKKRTNVLSTIRT